MNSSIGQHPAAISCLLLVLLFVTGAGCRAPAMRLAFPAKPIESIDGKAWYDVDGDGRRDFATRGAGGKVDAVEYDDNADGVTDRTYVLGEYANGRVPHLILLLDSIPFSVAADRYAAGHFRFADAPAKVICGFPSLTEVCYSEMLKTPPRAGMIDQYYDRRAGKTHDGLWHRFGGYEEPWERRLDYNAKFWEGGLSYLDPRGWLHAEIERARAAVDANPDRVTLAYVISASGMASKFGRAGIEEVLDAAERLCLRLLYDRQGAIKISILADHGHNLTPSTNLHVADVLKAAGFNPSDQLAEAGDVVIEMHGLVNYCGFHTRQPAKVADALLRRDEVEFAMYKSGERVIVRSKSGESSVASHAGNVAYMPGEADVLKLNSVSDVLRREGKLAADGSASDASWLISSADAEYPDAPRRIWDAFHGKAMNPPDVMITLRDGYCAGMPRLEKFIKMRSTHGSINQANSATFLLTMTGRGAKVLRGGDVLDSIEPGYVPRLRR